MPEFLRRYETITIVNPDSGPEGTDKVLGRMREALEKTGAREVRYEDWGRRKLAYELNRCAKGHYLYLNYLATGATVSELERMLGITEEAVKYQTVLLDPRIEVEKFDFEAAAADRTPNARSETATADTAEPKAPAAPDNGEAVTQEGER